MRGQPDTPTPPHIIEAACKALRDGRTGYADNQGEPALRRAVAEKLKREQGLSFDPDREILITDGATLGVCAALGALVDQADRLAAGPDLRRLSKHRSLSGAAVRRPSARSCATADSRSAAASSRTHGSRAPTSSCSTRPGTRSERCSDRDELADIMGFAERRDSLVISDEIYESLIYDGRRHVAPASVSADARERTILVNSLSKTYAMTGWRIGYCAGPEAIIRAMLLGLAAVEPRAGHVRARRGGLCPDLRSRMHASDGGRVPGTARSGRRDTARGRGREHARARRGTVRHGGHSRTGDAIRCCSPVPAYRSGCRCSTWLGLRSRGRRFLAGELRRGGRGVGTRAGAIARWVFDATSRP